MQKRRLLHIVLTWLILSLASGMGHAQQKPDPAQALAGIDQDVANAMRELHVPGAAVGVLVHSKVVLAKGYGIREATKTAPVGTDTEFAIGSMTKSFTALIAAQLVDEGKLEWERPVVSYVPSLQFYDPTATQLTTMRDLLSHRTGMAPHDFLRISTYLTRDQLVERIRYLEPNLTFRQDYEYNNLGYVLAGYVEGKVAGASWEDLVRQRIFTPLNMTRSNVSAVELQASGDFAFPHDMVNGNPQPTAFYDYQKFGVGPNGAVNASVSDMLKYLAFQLSDGTVDGKRVVSSAQLQHLHTPSVLVAGDTRYGFGWIVESYHGHTVLQHGGSVHGFTSHMLLLPDDGIAIVVLNNVASSLPRTISSSLRDRLLGLTPDDYLGKTLAQLKQDKQNDLQRRITFDAKASGHPSLPLAAYAGTYFHPAYGDIHVTVQGNRLIVHFDAYELQLRQYQHDTFAWDENLAQFQFDSSGNVTQLLLPLEPSVKPFKFLRTSK